MLWVITLAFSSGIKRELRALPLPPAQPDPRQLPDRHRLGRCERGWLFARHTAVPFAIFQLRGAFMAIPVDLEEAAMVDGATRGASTFCPRSK